MLSLAILDLVLSAFLVKLIAGFVLAHFRHQRQVCACPSAASSCACASKRVGPCQSACARRQQHEQSRFQAPQDIQVFDFELPAAFLHEHLIATLLNRADAPRKPTPPSNVAAIPDLTTPAPASIQSRAAQAARAAQGNRVPAHSFTEDPHGYTLTVELPGYSRSEIATTVADDIRQLRVRAQNTARGAAEVVVVVPRLGDLARVGASLQNGILTVHVARRERDGRVVEVAVADDSAAAPLPASGDATSTATAAVSGAADSEGGVDGFVVA
ncbi:hypothetical protein HDU82_005504 [Entophlyctis luteolus]|nr:hypothetical protein HDU82_005504 [Entophlyctis luteolus]